MSWRDSFVVRGLAQHPRAAAPLCGATDYGFDSKALTAAR